MSLNFPDSPHTGDTYTSGGTTWVWDGAKWTPLAAYGAAGGYLPLSGGTLTGPLVLAADPTLSLGAVTKQYVDSRFGAPVTISDTAPVSPKPGALWFDSVGSQLYCWYTDPNTSQWVVVVNQATGPPGLQGTPGATGPVGPSGQLGPIGPQGPVGNTGPQGPIGNTGPQGPIGNTGATGPKGDQGAVGPTGPQGNTGPQGLQGPAGVAGAQGPAGPQGPTGAMGPQGPSGAIAEAPTDGTVYLRRGSDSTWQSSGTVNGSLVVGYLAVNAPAGTERSIGFASSGKNQFYTGVTADQASWFLASCNDDGSYRNTSITVARSDSTATFTGAALNISGNLGVASGAINCPTYWNNPTFTGSVVINGNTDFYGTRTMVRGNGLLAYINSTQGGGVGSWAGQVSALGMVNSNNTLYFGSMNGDGSWAGGNRMWIDASSNMQVQGSISSAGSVTAAGNVTANNAHFFAQTSGARLILYGGCGWYSDGSYYINGDSGNPADSASWRFYYTKSSGQRNWVNYQGSNCFQISPGGACTCPGGFATGSDMTGKRDIEPATAAEMGMAALRKITPSYFHRIHDEPPEDQPGWKQPDRREFGFIAQDVQAALPDAVVVTSYEAPYLPEGETEMKSVTVSSLAIEIMPMLAALTNAVKELDKRLAALEAKNGS